jgi:hypothetical protein
MSIEQLPDYTALLRRGTTPACLRRSVSQFPDLRADITDAIGTIRDKYWDFFEDDEAFPGKMDLILQVDLIKLSFGDLLKVLKDLQTALTLSSLQEARRQAFWKPIAECYVRVRTVLEATGSGSRQNVYGRSL